MNTKDLIKTSRIDWSKVTNPKVKELYDQLVIATSGWANIDDENQASLNSLANFIEKKFPEAKQTEEMPVVVVEAGEKYYLTTAHNNHPAGTEVELAHDYYGEGPADVRCCTGDRIQERFKVPYTNLSKSKHAYPNISVIGSGATGLGKEIANRFGVEPTVVTPPATTKAENIAKAISTNSANKVKARKAAKGPDSARILGIADTFSMYNQAITQAELDAWLICHPTHVLNQHFEAKHTLGQLLDKGLIYYEVTKEGEFDLAYKYLYLAGEVAVKLRRLEQNKDTFIPAYGQSQYDKQVADLEREMPIAKRVDASNPDDKIFMLPHAEFAKQYFISGLHPDCPARLYEAASLYEAFLIYLNKINLQKFQPSTQDEVIKYVKNKAVNLKQEEKASLSEEKAKEVLQSRRTRAKATGDRLFSDFLENCLNDIDVQVINREWNRKFNGIKEVRLEKIPLTISHNSVFKKGSPLRFSDTQRNGVAGYEAKKSIMYGWDVGVGKTLGLCGAISNAFETGRASIHLQVVPDATYKKWIFEIKGGKDKDGRYIHGAIPQYNFLGWGNLNTTIVQNEVREYSDEELKILADHNTLKDGLNKQISANTVTEESLTDLKELLDKSVETGSFQEFIRERLKQASINIQQIIDNDAVKASEATILGSITAFKDAVLQEININIYTMGHIRPIPDKTIILVNYTGMVRLGLSVPARSGIRSRLYSILSQGDLDPKDEAALTKQIDASIGDSLREARLYLDEVGIDSFGIDEAHNMKKSFTKVAGEVTGKKDEGEVKRGTSRYQLNSGEPSQQGIHAFCLSMYIQQLNQGGNVITLTATPFTNNPLEVFSMLALTNYQRLEETGQENLLEFFNTFIREETQLVINAKGKPEFRPIVVGFNNLPQLRQIIFDIIDIKTGEDAKVVRPEAIHIPDITKDKKWDGIETYLQPSAQQKYYFQKIQEYMEGGQNIVEICGEAIANENMCTLTYEYILNLEKGFAKSGIDPSEEAESIRVLRSLSFQRLLAISPYLFACNDLPCPTAQQYIEESPKLDFTVKSIKKTKEYFEAKNVKMPGQVIYMNAGTHYFPLIKEYLTDPQFGIGFAKNEVELVFGEISKAQKENIKERFLSGECKVIIGSGSIKEGIDLQNYATHLYKILADWNPTDDNQVNGRIYRQGNYFAYVILTNVLMADSADVFTFQKLQEKTQRIKELLDKDGRKSQLDLDDVNPSEIKENLITDPRVKAELQIKRIVKELENNQVVAENDLQRLEKLRSSQVSFKNLYPKVVDAANSFNAVYAEYLKRQDKDEDIRKAGEHALSGKEGRYESKFNPQAEKYQLETYDATNYNPDYVERVNRRMIFVMQKWEEMKMQPEGTSITMAKYLLEDLVGQFRSVKPDFIRGAEQLGGMGLTMDRLDEAIEKKRNEIAQFGEEIAATEASLEERAKSNESQREVYLASLKTVDERVAEFATLNKYLDERMTAKPVQEEELISQEPKEEQREEEADSQSIIDTLEGLKVLIDLTEDTDERQNIQDTIDGLEVMLEMAA